jgi:hypothetical protein
MGQLKQVGGCDDGYSCPKVWIDTERGVARIQGDLVGGDGEAAVEIPLSMWEKR